MVEYASAAWTLLPGAYSAPQPPNWTKGKMEGKGGEGKGRDERMGTRNDFKRGRVGNRYGI